MTEQKYAKYLLTEDIQKKDPEVVKKNQEKQEQQRKSGNYIIQTPLFGLDDTVFKGAFYAGTAMYWDKKGTEPVETIPAHVHDFDEVLVFAGTIKDKPRELGGEIELWLEDEKYIITESTMIYIPKGVKHLPLIVRRIDSPIAFFSAGTCTEPYTKIIEGKKFGVDN
jgi:hypothetical protein